MSNVSSFGSTQNQKISEYLFTKTFISEHIQIFLERLTAVHHFATLHIDRFSKKRLETLINSLPTSNAIEERAKDYLNSSTFDCNINNLRSYYEKYDIE